MNYLCLIHGTFDEQDDPMACNYTLHDYIQVHSHLDQRVASEIGPRHTTLRTPHTTDVNAWYT